MKQKFRQQTLVGEIFLSLLPADWVHLHQTNKCYMAKHLFTFISSVHYHHIVSAYLINEVIDNDKGKYKRLRKLTGLS